MRSGDRWFKNAVIYSLSVPHFADSDGEHCGDLRGTERRLDHLVSLGATCVWLLPLLASPRRDFGYDVSDYYAVDPTFGHLGDLASLVDGAHQRGLRVVVDLALQHTSIDHPWFQAARRDPNGPLHDMYVWRDTEPDDLDDPKAVVWGPEGQRSWTYDEVAGRWYRHIFYPHEPDLNMDHPMVREELRRVVKFWLHIDVDGLRLDAGGRQTRQAADAYDGDELGWLRELRRITVQRSPDAMLIVEADQSPDMLKRYFADDEPGEMLLFNFTLSSHLFLALAKDSAEPVVRALKSLPCGATGVHWANFLRNHDELDLDQITDDGERQLVFERFAPDENMRIYGRGIRRRAGPMLGGDGPRLRLAYAALLALPGSPVLLWGDELPLGEDLSRPDRDAVRLPMPWPAVQVERRDHDSLLNWFAAAIRVRKELPHIGWGELTILDGGPPEVLALRHDWEGEAVVILCNFSDAPQQVELQGCSDLADPAQLLANAGYPAATALGGEPLELGGFGYRWFLADVTTADSGGSVPSKERPGARSSLAATTVPRADGPRSAARSEKFTATSSRSSPSWRT
jgi:maltose alpha-D-glucosyltransferase / alpha-amylase